MIIKRQRAGEWRQKWMQAEPIVDRIQRLAAEQLGVSLDDLLGPSRVRPVAFARHVAMYVARMRTDASYPMLARAFKRRNHTTVLLAEREIRRRLVSKDSRVEQAVASLFERLREPDPEHAR